ncbi:transcriptional regulator, DeoR family [Lachnospiraceae bacterium C7]|nr:transcriptional regulator, DeoR family [Lachnospiraceae bacterium C7]
MLAEERFAKILSIVEKNGSATIADLMSELEASESTVRRDLNTLSAKGLLTKVHGGAIAKNSTIKTMDDNYNSRSNLNMEDKIIIAKYAASLIKSDDFVYIDAGTTTSLIIDFLEEPGTVFVTNAVEHARRLSQKGYTVYILGGEFKASTEAIVGEEAIETLDKYNFTKGFWGTNGICVSRGITTPEFKEAMVKKAALKNCEERFIVADQSKFSEISSVKFADFDEVEIITTNLQQQSLKKYKNIMEVS